MHRELLERREGERREVGTSKRSNASLGVYIPTRLLQRTHSPRFSSENPPTEKSTDEMKTRYFAETGSLSTSLWFRGCRRAPPALSGGTHGRNGTGSNEIS